MSSKPVPGKIDGPKACQVIDCSMNFKYRPIDNQPAMKTSAFIAIVSYLITVSLQEKVAEEVAKSSNAPGSIIYLANNAYVIGFAGILNIFLYPAIGLSHDYFGPSMGMSLSMASLLVSTGCLAMVHFVQCHWLLLVARLACTTMHGFFIMQIVIVELYCSKWQSCRCRALTMLGLSHSVAQHLSIYITDKLFPTMGVDGLVTITLVLATIQAGFCAIMPLEQRRGTENRTCEIEPKEMVKYVLRKMLTRCTWKAFETKHWKVFFLRALVVLPFYCYQSVFPQMAHDVYNLKYEQSTLMILAAKATMFAMHWTFICKCAKEGCVPPVTKWWIFAVMSAYAMQIVSLNTYQMYATNMGMIVMLAILNVMFTMELTADLNSERLGFFLGFNMALFQLSRFVAPVIGQYIVSRFDYATLGYYGVFSSGLACLYAFGFLDVSCLAEALTKCASQKKCLRKRTKSCSR